MALKIVGLMHAWLRVGPSDEDLAKAEAFYGDLLGLRNDETRPHIPGIPGFWAKLPGRDPDQQIHIFGAEGASPVARSDKQDPTRAHIALLVEDIDEAREELTRSGVEFWVYESLVGNNSDQVFFEDPFGNMIELQQRPS